MKWAKKKADVDEIHKRLKKLNGFPVDSEMKYYEELTGEPDLKSLHNADFSKWLIVPKLPPSFECSRARYETFVGGFISFFERHISPEDERTLYFDWGKINTKAELTIFLKPLHDKKNMIIADYTGIYKENKNGEYIQTNKKYEGKILYVKKKGPKPQFVSPEAGTTDPPPPQPPPPPPREE